MHCSIISLFPEMFLALNYGICHRAQKQGLLTLEYINPRDFTKDIHRTVDDRPYGGGPGMLMKIEPLLASIMHAKVKHPQAKVLYVSPQGKRLQQQDLVELSSSQSMIILCGRYEGIDQRLIDKHIDQEVSIGDYVLSGGELAAMVMVDAMTRLIPGALGHEQSAMEDSFMHGLLDCPHYTRPEVFNDLKVPEVLLSGNHENIARWRLKQALGQTWLKRPDLLEKKQLSTNEVKLLDEFKCEFKPGKSS